MHMFETFESSWQRTAEHQGRLLRSADWRQGRHVADTWSGRRSGTASSGRGAALGVTSAG